MKVIKQNKLLYEMILITIGTFLLSVSITVFYAPNNLVTGGFTGLAIIIADIALKYFNLTVPIWLTNTLLNIPLFLLSIKTSGKKFLFKTFFATILLSFMLFFTGFLPKIDVDLFLASVFGGVLGGTGLGLVFLGLATTGGTDLVAFLINKFIKHISVSKLILYLDSAIVLIGLFIFGPINAMYAIIAIYINSKCIEGILEGLNFAKAVFIISDHCELISKKIMETTERGVTGLNGMGMYSGNDKTVLLTVVSVKEIIKVKEETNKIDKNAFIIVADVREVLGEGFQSIS